MMGRSLTFTFRVKLVVHSAETGQPRTYTPFAWRVKESGRPTDENLAAYVQAFEDSTKPGGVNAHLGREVVSSAKVRRQSTGEVVATYTAPVAT